MNLKPVNTMERITRQQLADNFDEILDKVISENIGYVILDNDGKDGQVLCPAEWLNDSVDSKDIHAYMDRIKALKEKNTVGYIGDGVNDILALKEADCGIALASGISAARSVSEVVLTDSDFSILPNIVNEGRRIVNNIERVASMYLIKTIYSFLLSIICIIFYV